MPEQSLHQWSLTLDKVGVAVGMMPASVIADFLEATAAAIRKRGPKAAGERLQKALAQFQQKQPGLITIVNIDETGLSTTDPGDPERN